MRTREIISVAVDDAGRIFCSDGVGVSRLEGDRFVAHAELPHRTQITSIASRPGGGVLVVDAYANRLLEVGADGVVTTVAGRSQLPSLDRRANRRDGPAAEALFRAPHLVAASRRVVFCVELPQPDPVVRRIEGGLVETIGLRRRGLGAIAAAAAGPDGSLLLASSDGPAVLRLGAGGGLDVLAGSPDEPGEADGAAADARFVRIAALAALPTGGLAIADGARLRHLGLDGRVTSPALPRFETIRAIAAAPDGSVVVADGVLWRVSAAGDVALLARDAAAPEAGHAAEKAFGVAVVEGDVQGAWSIAESLLAAHASSGRARPDRSAHPVSVASARVGRELALAWSVAEEPDRARLGAYCLWLIRSEEGRGATAGDAARLVGALDRAIEAGDRARAARAIEALGIAFGELARRRDRLAVAAAYRGSRAVEAVPQLLASRDAASRDLGITIAAQSRDIRFTPQLAALAEAPRALDALRAIWESPAYTAEQRDALRAGLRFGHGAVDRLLAVHGDAALGPRGTARYRRVASRDEAP